MQGTVPPDARVTYGGPGRLDLGVPAPAIVAAVAPQREVGFKPRHQRTMRNLSVLQIAIGASCAIIYIVLLAVKRKSSSYSSSRDYHDMQSAGIWCGGVYIVAGSLGLAAARLNRLSLIISAMILSIFSSIILWTVIGFAAAAIDTSIKNEGEPCFSYFSGYYYPSSFTCVVHNFSGYKTADSMLIILSVAELIVSIWCAVLCCKGSCKACCSCCCYETGYGYPTSVMYYTQAHSAGQQVIFLPQASVPGSQAISIMPAQASYLGMQQQPVLFAQPAATAAATAPGYHAGAAEPPEYTATQTGTGAAVAAAYVQRGELTKGQMADGY